MEEINWCQVIVTHTIHTSRINRIGKWAHESRSCYDRDDLKKTLGEWLDKYGKGVRGKDYEFKILSEIPGDEAKILSEMGRSS